MNEKIGDNYLGFVTMRFFCGIGFSTNEQMLETNLQELSFVALRILYERVSKEGVILKVDIRKKTLSGVKLSWRFAKAAEVKNKNLKLFGKKVRKKEREMINN